MTKYVIKNSNPFPIDLPTLDGPGVLGVNAESDPVRLDALTLEVFRNSPGIEVVEVSDKKSEKKAEESKRDDKKADDKKDEPKAGDKKADDSKSKK